MNDDSSGLIEVLDSLSSPERATQKSRALLNLMIAFMITFLFLHLETGVFEARRELNRNLHPEVSIHCDLVPLGSLA